MGGEILYESSSETLINTDEIFKEKEPEYDDQNDEDYLNRLLMKKDIYYRKKNNLESITKCGDDPYKYAKYMIDLSTSVENSNSEEEDGELCPYCNKKVAFITLLQMRRGDEGSALVLQCTDLNCNRMVVLSS